LNVTSITSSKEITLEFITNPAFYSLFSFFLTFEILVHNQNIKTKYTVISGRLPAPVVFCQNEKKDSADYPHWQITHTKKQKKVMLKRSLLEQSIVERHFCKVERKLG